MEIDLLRRPVNVTLEPFKTAETGVSHRGCRADSEEERSSRRLGLPTEETRA